MQAPYTDIIDFNKETSQIMNRIRCLTIDQFREFFPENPERLREYAIKSVYYFAQNFHTILIKNKEIFINATNPEYRQDIIDCTWVMLNIFQNSSKEYGSALCHKACQEAETPYCLQFFLDNKFYKLVHIANHDELAKVLYARDSFYAKHEGKHGKEDESFTKNVFVLRDESLLEDIAEYELQIPHIIALLTGEPNKKPKIEIFE